MTVRELKEALAKLDSSLDDYYVIIPMPIPPGLLIQTAWGQEFHFTSVGIHDPSGAVGLLHEEDQVDPTLVADRVGRSMAMTGRTTRKEVQS